MTEKAHDKVEHIFLNKLNLFVFSENGCIFIISYLFSRQKQVEVVKKLSVTFITSSGVPQESNWGPLLSSIFKNNLARCIKINKWFQNNRLSAIVSKCQIITITRKTNFTDYRY